MGTNPADRRRIELSREDIEREIRQLRLMSETIEAFSSSTIPIHRAINKLAALAGELQHASRAWHGAFVYAWSDLEVPYAVALDRLEPIPDATAPTVGAALSELRRLIAQHLSQLGQGTSKATSRGFPCPCCGHVVFAGLPGSYDICPICFWEDDIVQLRWPDFAGGANLTSLIESQRNYEKIGAIEERLLKHVRAPKSTDVREASWRMVDPERDRFESRDENTKDWPNDPTSLYWWRDTYWR